MSLQEMKKEIVVMNTSNHKNIVDELISFISGNQLYIVMELLGAGSCLSIVKHFSSRNCPGIAEEAVIATILRETMLGLQYLHKNNKIHRDIKCGNILLNMAGHVYLSDFGVSANIKKGMKRDTLVGSPCWMAPEVMDEKGHDQKADIWSLGITAIELALGDPPHSSYPPVKVIMMIINQDPPTLPSVAPPGITWSPEFKAFIAACLQKNPVKRPTVDELFKEHAGFFA